MQRIRQYEKINKFLKISLIGKFLYTNRIYYYLITTCYLLLKIFAFKYAKNIKRIHY